MIHLRSNTHGCELIIAGDRARENLIRLEQPKLVARAIAPGP